MMYIKASLPINDRPLIGDTPADKSWAPRPHINMHFLTGSSTIFMLDQSPEPAALPHDNKILVHTRLINLKLFGSRTVLVAAEHRFY